ncbi:MAG TPA: DNA replication/repair protein RecF [Limnochordales bacterium]
MRILSLRLAQFRNYESAELEPDPRLNLVVGPNAQGKTNLLEAIWVLGGARSPRASDPRAMIRFGHSQAVVEARLSLDATGAERDLRLDLRPGGRLFRLNGKAVTRHADVLGTLAALWFSPDEVDVVRGGPAHRRRFLDLTLAQADPLYRAALLRYAQVLRQRNGLLRVAAKGASTSPALLATWDEELAQSGAELVVGRLGLLHALAPGASAIYQRMAGDGARLEVAYQARYDIGSAESPDVAAIRQGLLRRLQALRVAERARGVTLAGPHRDDMVVRAGETDLRHYGSRGQQRMAAVALFVAAWQWMRDRLGEAPVLLLDDVTSELDEVRRRRLLEVLPCEAQTFITATEPSLLHGAGSSPWGAGRTWRVSAGRLEVVSGR